MSKAERKTLELKITQAVSESIQSPSMVSNEKLLKLIRSSAKLIAKKVIKLNSAPAKTKKVKAVKKTTAKKSPVVKKKRIIKSAAIPKKK